MYILITGANRGIGLELVRQCVARGDRVGAGVRSGSDTRELQKIVLKHPDHVGVLHLPVDQQALVQEAALHAAQTLDALDVLVNNAGINPETPAEDTFGALQEASVLHVLHVNAVAPLIVAQAFMPLLKKSPRPRIINITSEMGSLADKTYGGSYAYCMSKAALNMATRGMAADLRKDDIPVVALDPGWVRTDMGGPSASLSPAESVRGILRVIDTLTLKDTGRYLDYTGRDHRW
ncbi:MAG: SDR family oxidoreductase [Chloroflexi bacterium]|nr:SDR family oxidoreductase [Chloroflexota bacterium]